VKSVNDYKQRYVERGFEDELIRSLDEYDSVSILGLPGVGKTTTAMYVYAKLKEIGKKVVYLSSGDSKTIYLTYEGKEAAVRCISIRSEEGRGRELSEALAYVVVKAIEGSIFDRLRGKARDALDWLINKFGGERAERIEKVKVRLVRGGEEVREVAEKLHEWFEGVFGEIIRVKGVKDKIEKFLEKVHEMYLVDFLVALTVFVMGGLGLYSIIKAFKELLEKEPEIEEDIVIIIDDLSDFDEYEVVNFVKFLRGKKVKVLLVKRLESYDKYVEVLEFLTDRSKQIDIDFILFRGAKDYFDVDLRERIFLMGFADRGEFEEIVRANGYDFEDFDLLYRASAGVVSVAIWMLELGYGVKDVKRILEEAGRVYTHYEILREENKGRKRKMLESNRTILFRAICDIYERLLDDNVCHIALLFNWIAEDELERFCKDERIRDRFGGVKCRTRFINPSLVEKCEEEWVNGKRTVYRVKGEWRKLSHLVESFLGLNVIEELEERRRRIEEDIKVIRDVLVDIYDKELERTGKFTTRMVYFALENLRWLHDKGVERLKSSFAWGSVALRGYPGWVGKILPIILKLLEKVESRDTLLYALNFVGDLVEGGVGLFNKEKYGKIAERVTEFLESVENDEVTCYWKARIYSSLIEKLDYFALPYKTYIIKSGRLKDLANIEFLISKGQIEARRKPEKAIKTFKECLEILERLEYDECMCEVFKPLGGSPKEKFKDRLREWKRAVYYNLGVVYFYYSDLSEAGEFFEKSLEFTKWFEDELVTKSLIGRIKVLKDYKFEFKVREEKYDFEKLWNSCLEKLSEIYPKNLARLCAEYLISSIVCSKFKDDDRKYLEFIELDDDTKVLFYGLSYILGAKLKGLEETIEILKDYDVEYIQDDRAKAQVKKFYESTLDKGEYEKVKEALVKGFGELGVLTFSSDQALVRIMFFYIVGDLKSAKDLASEVSSLHPPVLSNLFRELAEGINEEIKAKSDAEKEEARKKVKEAFVKLFYWHV